MFYPKQLYRDGRYRVVHSPEEHASLESEGWSDEKPEGVVHVVHTAALALASQINREAATFIADNTANIKVKRARIRVPIAPRE